MAGGSRVNSPAHFLFLAMYLAVHAMGIEAALVAKQKFRADVIIQQEIRSHLHKSFESDPGS
jgi:hypothetical protein